MKNSPLKEKSYKLAIRIVQFYKYLIDEKREYILSKQVLRSGTAICALIREAEFGQSRADFISKLSISLKEANETEYWISLLFDTGYIDEREFVSIHNDIVEMIKILISSIKTTKENR